MGILPKPLYVTSTIFITPLEQEYDCTPYVKVCREFQRYYERIIFLNSIDPVASPNIIAYCEEQAAYYAALAASVKL